LPSKKTSLRNARQEGAFTDWIMRSRTSPLTEEVGGEKGKPGKVKDINTDVRFR